MALTIGTPAWAWPPGLPFPRPHLPLPRAAVPVRLYVPVPPPPVPVVTVRPVRPAAGYVWVSGYQRWNGASYVWVPGHWSRPPRAHAHYQRAVWKHDRRGWYLVGGGWR